MRWRGSSLIAVEWRPRTFFPRAHLRTPPAGHRATHVPLAGHPAGRARRAALAAAVVAANASSASRAARRSDRSCVRSRPLRALGLAVPRRQSPHTPRALLHAASPASCCSCWRSASPVAGALVVGLDGVVDDVLPPSGDGLPRAVGRDGLWRAAATRRIQQTCATLILSAALAIAATGPLLAALIGVQRSVRI